MSDGPVPDDRAPDRAVSGTPIRTDFTGTDESLRDAWLEHRR
ncbi:hypothetical protein ACQBAT_12525 [Ornithinimicrobium sp. Y1847]